MSRRAQNSISVTINTYNNPTNMQNKRRERSSEPRSGQLQEVFLNPLDYSDSPQGSSSSHSNEDEMLNSSFRVINKERLNRRSSISSVTTRSSQNTPIYSHNTEAAPSPSNRSINDVIKFKDSKKNFKRFTGNPSKKPRFESVQDLNSLLPGSINHSKYERCVEILNKEAEELVHALAPIKEDYCLRQCVIKKITKALEDAIPKSIVEDFDDFNSKLSLPNEGLDLGIFIPSEISNRRAVDKWVSKIDTFLCESELAYNLEPLTIDGLPIIKFKFPNLEYKIYLSIHLNSDQISSNASLRCSKEYPAAKQLYLLVKYFLYKCKNSAYSYKLESHTIFFMSIYFLQNYQKCRSLYFNPLKNLGLLFFEFLDFYGNKFDKIELDISTDNEGIYKVPLPSPKIYKKVKVSEYNLDHLKNRVSYSSFSYNSIKNEFIHAHKALVNELMYVEVKYRSANQFNNNESVEILGKILTLSNEDSQRKILVGYIFKETRLCLNDFLSIRDQNGFY